MFEFENIVKKYWEGIDEGERSAKAEVLDGRTELQFAQQVSFRTSVYSLVAISVNQSMVKKGFGKHWYSPQRLVWQFLVNRMWSFNMDMAFAPERTIGKLITTLERVTGSDDEFSLGFDPDTLFSGMDPMSDEFQASEYRLNALKDQESRLLSLLTGNPILSEEEKAETQAQLKDVRRRIHAHPLVQDR